MITALPTVKEKYCLTDLATFKLCPTLYLNKIRFTQKDFCTREQEITFFEAEVLSRAFEDFAKDNLESGKVYFKSTTTCDAELAKYIFAVFKENCSRLDFEYEEEQLSMHNILKKAHSTISDIKKIIKGSRFTVIPRLPQEKNLGDFVFVRESGIVFKDIDNEKVRSLYVNEYKNFPVTSAGKNFADLIHYSDIMAILDGSDISADRVALVAKLIRKITIQLESYYESDGFDRIKSLAEEIKNYDFSHCHKKESGFCRYCKFRDICF